MLRRKAAVDLNPENTKKTDISLLMICFIIGFNCAANNSSLQFPCQSVLWIDDIKGRPDDEFDPFSFW